MPVKHTDEQLRTALPDGLLVAIHPVGRELQALRADTGEDVTNFVRRWTRKQAADANCGLRIRHTRKGSIQFRKVPMEAVEQEMRIHRTSSSPVASAVAAVSPIPPSTSTSSNWALMDDADVRTFVQRSMEFKPDKLVIEETKWKYLCRSTLRGKNILMIGHSGCGKTLACQSIHEAFNERPWFYFNLGASQDARGMLIGNTHFDQGAGTFFSDALFVRAIQTPGAIILLDELSRAHDDAPNILMTVLDENQRYLRIDERPDTPTIKVAPGVVFLATANVGNEYTGVRVMDRALLDRFIIIEMEPLSKDDEKDLLLKLYPDLDQRMAEAVAEIASSTRAEVKSEDPKVNTVISTRMSVEMASLLRDGFSLAEAATVCVYPFYSSAGGADSERTFMMQLVQKYLPTDFDSKNRPWDKDDDTKVPWE